MRLLAKFRIDASDVIVIPDVTKKAEAETKAEFDQMISGCDITKDELNNEREKTNRYAYKFAHLVNRMYVIPNSHFKQAFEIGGTFEAIFVRIGHGGDDVTVAKTRTYQSSIVHGLVGRHDEKPASDSFGQGQSRACSYVLLLNYLTYNQKINMTYLFGLTRELNAATSNHLLSNCLLCTSSFLFERSRVRILIISFVEIAREEREITQ